MLLALDCNYCKLSIAGEYIKYDNKNYHERCYDNHIALKCFVCNKKINEKYLEHNSKPCHERCYIKNIAPKCDICNSPIHNEKYYTDNWGNEYHIFKLKTEISIIVRAIVEAQYYVGEMSREDAVAFLQKMAFMKKDEADMIQLESDLHFFSGTQSFIGMMEMNSLYNEYKRNQGDEFNILEFHRIVLSNGIIPLYELKKQILLP